MNQIFEKDYWDQNYSEPQTMDGVGNAKAHAKYLKSLFDLDLIDISSIIDLGFGLGHMFQQMMKLFVPYKACGIEPSQYVFAKTSKRKLKPVESTKLILLNESIQNWCKRKDSPNLRFDLGLCNSVFQYITKDDLEFIIPILARRIKYLYLTLPTDIELDRQITELDFNDTFAIRRSRSFYRELLAPYFTNISSRLWESKFYFDEQTTLFTDLLYRS
jgi:hypothetical protein